VRLSEPVSSYSAKPGAPVRGFLLTSPECNNSAIFPVKVPVEGQVVSVRKVGMGIRHETSALQIQFLRILLPDRDPIEISAHVKQVDNGRDLVKKGVIRGIRSTDTPQGRISSRLKYLPSLHLYPDPFLLAFKMLFPIFPEPEIDLEPGTDLQVELVQAVDVPARLAPVPQIAVLNPPELPALPERTFTKNGKLADVVNLVFAASQSDLEQAFQAAGWQQSEAVSTRTVLKDLNAFLDRTSYATAPISAQLLENRKPDLMLEKVNQSHGKRNHVRIWKLDDTWDGVPLWASSAVRETGATLSIRNMGFIHHVAEDLDEEQNAVIRDLAIADCVASLGTVARPGMEHVLRNANGEFFRTDGSLYVIRLQPCSSDSGEAGLGSAHAFRPGSRVFRYLRRQILTVRSDLFRANCIYALLDLTRMTIGALRQNSARNQANAAFRQEQTLRLSQPDASLSEQMPPAHADQDTAKVLAGIGKVPDQ